MTKGTVRGSMGRVRRALCVLGAGLGLALVVLVAAWAAEEGGGGTVDVTPDGPQYVAVYSDVEYTATCTCNDGCDITFGDVSFLYCTSFWPLEDEATNSRTVSGTADTVGYHWVIAECPDGGDHGCDSSELVVCEVDKLRYKIGEGDYADVPDPLFVAKGTTVDFKAIIAPSGATWPSGKPVWGGTSGASGTGGTKSVPFNTASTSSTDYKTVTAECGNSTPLPTANVIVFELKLSQVGFSGAGEHAMEKTGAANYSYAATTFGSAGGTAISDPVWKDVNLNGSVADAGDTQNPICFTKGSTPTLAAKIALVPALTGAVPGQLRVITPTTPETVYLEKNVSLTGAELDINDALQTAFGANVNCVDWQLQWKVSVDGAPCVSAGNSTHLTFVTYGTPTGSAVTAKRVHWVTTKCITKSNLNPDNIPRAMQAGVQAEGAGHFQGGAWLPNPWSLFDPGVKGPCTTYAEVMKLGLRMLGVPQAKTTRANVTSHSVATTTWLGQAVAYSVLRWFDEWSCGPWVNEGVCGVNTDGSGWLYYDVAGGSAYGPQAAAGVGAQYATRPTALVANQWREPLPSHGPIMKDWEAPPLFSNGIDNALAHQVKVKSPNGGENIAVGTNVTVTFYTAGLQTLKMKVYYRKQGTTTDVLIGDVTVAAAAAEAGNFSKESSIAWDTTGVAAGDYWIRVLLEGQTSSRYSDWSDATFKLQ